MTNRGKALLIALTVAAVSAASAAEEDVAIKSVTNGEATISYYAQGEGPLVLFIGSQGRGTAEFGELAGRLAERGYRVLRPEPRGIGASTGPMEDATFHDFADDFAAVIRNEGDRAIVAGHAYGNWIARTIASDYPEMTRGVVLVAASGREWPRELSDTIRIINDPASTREERLAGLRLVFFADGNDPTPWLEGWHPDVAQAQWDARNRTEQSDWWASGTAPILDLPGGSDPFRPASSRQEIKEEFGDRVTLKVIEGASHALPAEKPVEVADVSTNTIVGPLRAALHNPVLADRWQQLGQVLRFETTMPTRLNELAILVTARRWNSQLEWTIHARDALRAGLPEEWAEAIRTGRLPDFGDDTKARNIYEYARQLLCHGDATEEAYERILASWGDVAVVELTAVVGYYSMVAMTLNAHQVPVPDGMEADLPGPRGQLFEIPPLA